MGPTDFRVLARFPGDLGRILRSGAPAWDRLIGAVSGEVSAHLFDPVVVAAVGALDPTGRAVEGEEDRFVRRAATVFVCGLCRWAAPGIRPIFRAVTDLGGELTTWPILLSQARTAAHHRGDDGAAAFPAAPVLLIAASEPFAMQSKVGATALVDLADPVATMVTERTAGAATADLALVATAVTAGWSVGTADGGVSHLCGEEADRAADADHAGAIAALAAAAMFGIAAGSTAAGLGGSSAAALIAALVVIGAGLTGQHVFASSIRADTAALAGVRSLAVLAVLGIVGDAGAGFVVAGLTGIAAEAALIDRGRTGAGGWTADLAAGATVDLVRPRERANLAATAGLAVDTSGGVRATGPAATLLRGRVATGGTAAILETARLVRAPMLARAAVIRGDAFPGGAASLGFVAARFAGVGAIRGLPTALTLLAGIAVALAFAAGAHAAAPAGFAVLPGGNFTGHGAGFAETTRTAGIEIRNAMAIEADTTLAASSPILNRLGHAAPSLDAGMHGGFNPAAAERSDYCGDRTGK